VAILLATYCMSLFKIKSAKKSFANGLGHVEQKLLTPSEHLSSHPIFSWVRVARSLVFCVMFCIFGHFICLSLDLRLLITNFGIFKLFSSKALY
jgi:hypothetical protein